MSDSGTSSPASEESNKNDVKVQNQYYGRIESEPINLTPTRSRAEDAGQNVILTPPKDDKPPEYDSTYIFEDSMTEDLDISPVMMNRTFSFDDSADEDGDEDPPDVEGNPDNESSFTISSSPSTEKTDPNNVMNNMISISDEEEEDFDPDDYININVNSMDPSKAFNLSVIYEENSFELTNSTCISEFHKDLDSD